MFEISLV